MPATSSAAAKPASRLSRKLSETKLDPPFTAPEIRPWSSTAWTVARKKKTLKGSSRPKQAKIACRRRDVTRGEVAILSEAYHVGPPADWIEVGVQP